MSRVFRKNVNDRLELSFIDLPLFFHEKFEVIMSQKSSKVKITKFRLIKIKLKIPVVS